MKVFKIAFVIASTFAFFIVASPDMLAQEEAEGDAGEIVDVTAITCRDLLLMNNEDEEAAVMFIQGYLSGKNGDVEIDVDAIRSSSDRSFEQCIDAPDSTMMSVFEQNR